jgi:hypothetical protein
MKSKIKKTITILANSYKHGHSCVAGKCISSGAWVRPVSSNEGGALTNQQKMYSNKFGNYSVKLLQNIEMSFERHAPLPNQPENFLISDMIWQQRYSFDKKKLNSLLDVPESLWGSGDRVSYNCIINGQQQIVQSLYLIQASNFSLATSSVKPRAKFEYNRTEYNLAVTDPHWMNKQDEGISRTPIICLSLGEVFNGDCFKLIANIF